MEYFYVIKNKDGKYIDIDEDYKILLTNEMMYAYHFTEIEDYWITAKERAEEWLTAKSQWYAELQNCRVVKVKIEEVID